MAVKKPKDSALERLRLSRIERKVIEGMAAAQRRRAPFARRELHEMARGVRAALKAADRQLVCQALADSRTSIRTRHYREMLAAQAIDRMREAARDLDRLLRLRG